MGLTETTGVIGALNEEERSIIDERDRLRDKFFAAETEDERSELMAGIQNLTLEYDRLRTERWQKGEIK